MSWTIYPNKVKSVKKQLDAIFNTEKRKVLKSKIVCNIYYAAIEIKNSSEIFALICKFENKKNFSYKEMSEYEHPYYYNCPEKILNLLSETYNGNALSWRLKVKNNIKKYNDLSENVGKTFIFSEAFKYQGSEYTIFILKKEDNHYYFYNKVLGKSFKIKNIIDYDYTIIN